MPNFKSYQQLMNRNSGAESIPYARMVIAYNIQESSLKLARYVNANKIKLLTHLSGTKTNVCSITNAASCFREHYGKGLYN